MSYIAPAAIGMELRQPIKNLHRVLPSGGICRMRSLPPEGETLCISARL